MKKILQLSIIFLIFLISLSFYLYYFKTDPITKTNSRIITQEKENNDPSIESEKNNLIKNLKYEIRLDENKQYLITSDLSELTYKNQIEIVKMQKVVAIFIDQTNVPLTIISDYAKYNSSIYNTNFEQNVKVEYLDNVILSDRMDLNFNENFISIYGNVKYESLKGIITTDNIKIDLITKKIEIYMNDEEEKVKVTTK